MARVIVFDSGLGGLSVYRAINRVMRQLDLTYMADFKAFPYGAWNEERLMGHLIRLMGRIIADLEPDVIVVACNTASTLVLNDLRQAYPGVPFIGTVPAIKPAAQLTRTGMFSVLATPGTARRSYTADLIHEFAHDRDVTVVAAQNLAQMAEDRLQGKPIDMDALKAEILPAFVERDAFRTDTIVLGCTHYPLILRDIRQVAPWEVTWIDPAPAIAKRLYTLLDEKPTGNGYRMAYHTNDFNTYGQERIFRAFGFDRLAPFEEKGEVIEL